VSPSSARWSARHSPALWLLLGCTLAHLGLSLAFHLSPDEAHYALYAAHPDWSYFDHPPLVGWLQWPWAALGGADVLMRIVPMVCWLLTGWGLMRLSTALVGGSPGGVALTLLCLSPLHHLRGFALVPDTLLMPLTCAVMWLSLQLRDPVRARRIGLWALLGASLGLAGLAKYTAIYLALGCAAVLLQAWGWRLFRLPGLWLSLGLALLLVVPVLLWNATHDWISFAYQAGHAAGQREWRPVRVLAFVLVQLLAFGLLPAVGLVLAARRWRAEPGPAALHGGPGLALWFAAAFGLPALATFVYLSGRGTTLPHWSAFAWVALLPAAAWGVDAMWRRARQWLAAWQVLGCLVLAALMLSAGFASEQGAQMRSLPGVLTQSAPRNPFADLHGWDAAAKRAAQLAADNQVKVLAVMNWSLASRIAWYARPLPVRVVQRHFDQFDLWFGALRRGDSVLLVDWSLMSFAPPTGAGQFEQCRLLDTQAVTRGERQIAHFNFLLCSNWQSDPEVRRGF
jgi:4-amino-4-deoxy-L-arabinose transferase-like glycosyltransferase